MDASRRWAIASDATLARLGRQVVNDTSFFTRLDCAGASTTTATLEKFARFLINPANWPDGLVAEEAKKLAHVTGVSVHAGPASAGNVRQTSTDEAAA